jgi:GT2 family glycosyltransferase/tetratricopeptide (TPR) repeat protein/2-polyprenyl-3-methyl-5-hydroxy-6-metoxy-1,4-benzoquinol methylase
VTLETKCWEGDWERILKTDHLRVLAAHNGHPFACRMLMINNVSDPEEVCRWAHRAVDDGRLTRFVVVEDRADEALGFFGLTREELGRGYVYSIAELVAIYLCETDYLLHFSGDSFLPVPCEWIPPALAVFEGDERVRVANPTKDEDYREARRESFEESPDWYLGFGFSDQCYLVRTADFRARIYGEKHPASARYPDYGGDLFEKRVDSWMRTHGWVRATYRHGFYFHHRAREASSYRTVIGEMSGPSRTSSGRPSPRASPRPRSSATPADESRPASRPAPRVAVVYDDAVRPDTTGGYCLRALRELADVTHLRPGTVDATALAGDFLLRVDDDLDFALPAGSPPAAFWAIDTHRDFGRRQRQAVGFATVFAAQKEGAERFRREGFPECEWLPLACDPEVHGRLEVEKEYDVAFVGHINSRRRRDFLEAVRQRFPRSFLGPAPHTQMSGIYSRARVVVNCNLHNDLNMRVFEALSCGALLVTNRVRGNGQEELFQDRVHLVEYDTTEEALELIHYYLQRPEEAAEIAGRGHREVVGKHTYRHRMERVLARLAEADSRGQSRPAQLTTSVSGPRPAPAWGGRDAGYFRGTGEHLLEIVPRAAKRVLDVGCGAGVFGEVLKKRQGCEVVGVEIDARAAAEARGRLDHVVEGDVEGANLEALGSFDVVVCGDILEHLREPGELLGRLRRLLAVDGLLVAHVPNARNMDIVQQLVEGNWTYQPWGLMDREHLRFFTRRSAEQMLEEAGYEVTGVRGMPARGLAGWQQAGRPRQITAGRLAVSDLDPEEAEEFFIAQWLVTARPAARVDWGLTSIIIPTWNQLPYTQRCLESIRTHTHLPYELIFVDNGSTDGTREWLASLSGVHVIANETNLGFPKACNQGLSAARGENLLLLNNDTVVTPGWLRRMLEHLHGAEDVGLVGPLTNYAVGDQRIDPPYRDLAQLDGFAWELGRRQRGKSFATGMLVGFCLLTRREVLDRIGLLDEEFGLGTFEDTDLSFRVTKAGYRLLVCQDAFVHHFGSRTISSGAVEVHDLLEQNRRRFEAKWGLEGRPGVAEPEEVDTGEKRAAGQVGGERRRQEEATSVRGRPRISLCMIARDEESHLRECLESVRLYVEEMIVVDTGSRDRTAEIARECGAKLIEGQWRDSFSAARNLSLEHATGDWVFWMDADDVLPPESGEALRRAVEGAGEKLLGFVAQVRCPPGPGDFGDTVVDHVKLFRNRPDLRFELRLHEQVLPSIRRAGGEIAPAPITVLHRNYDFSAQAQQRKRERDRRLLALDLEENPEHPFVHFNVGMTAAHEGDHGRAVDHLRRSLELAKSHESHVRKAYALLASSYRAQGLLEEALRACEEGRSHYPEDPELMFQQAMVQQSRGKLSEAAALLEQLLGKDRPRDYLASVDAGIVGYKARHNLGVVYSELGRRDDAARQWRQVTQEEPSFRPSWQALGELLIAGGEAAELAALAAEAQRVDGVTGDLLRGQAARRRGDLEEAERRLRAAAGRESEAPECQRLLSYVLLERGERDEVEDVLRRLIELDPRDGEAHHNLGALLLERGRAREAVPLCERAVDLRPGYEPSRDVLARALRQTEGAGPSESPRPA